MTAITKPTIGIADNNSPTRRVANGHYEFLVYADRAVSPNLPINLRYYNDDGIVDDTSTIITIGNAESILQIPQSRGKDTTEFRIEIIDGTGYRIAESPNNEVTVKLTTLQISIDTESIYAVRGESIEYTLTASSPVSTDTLVNLEFYETLFGRVISTATATISAGQSSKRFYVDTNNFPTSEYIAIQIVNPANYPNGNYFRKPGRFNHSKVVQLTDTTNPWIELTAVKNKIFEGTEDGKFIISATPPPVEDLVVELEIIYSSHINDKPTERRFITIPAGSSRAELLIPIEDDHRSNPDQYSINVYIIQKPHYDYAYFERIEKIRVFDDDPPIISIEYAHQEIIEGEPAKYWLYANTALREPMNINVRITESGNFVLGEKIDTLTIGTNFADEPYADLSTAPEYILIPTEDDDVFEPNGRIFFEVLPGEGYIVEELREENWVYVEDNDNPTGMEIVAITSEVIEGDEASFELYTQTSSPEERRVNLSVNNISGNFLATNPPSFVIIRPNYRYVDFSIPTIDDEVFEIDGAVEVTLEAGDGYLVNESQKQAYVVVRDNDEPVGLSIVPLISSVTEGEDVEFQISSFSNQQQDLSVAVEISQVGDFLAGIAETRSAIIPSGSDVGLLNVSTINDEIDEQSGYIVATLAADQGENTISSYNRAVVLVEDDDIPTVSITNVADTVIEGNEIRFNLIADQPPANNVFIQLGFAQEGNFVVGFVSNTTTILNLGETNAVAILQTRDNDIDEHEGSVTATILEGHGYLIETDSNNSSTVRVTDNDETPVMSIYADLASVSEGTEGLFTISADRVSGFDKEIRITTTADPADLIAGELPSTVLLKAFSLSTSLNVALADDNIYGNEGQISVSLNSGSGYFVSDTLNSASVLIVDNEELPIISFAPQINEVIEGERVNFVLTTSRNSVSDLDINIDISASSNDLLDPRAPIESRVTLAALTESANVEVVTANNLVEGDGGTITLTILPDSDYEITDESSQISVLVVDDDTSPEISISTSTPNITEGETGSFQISASNPVVSDRVINIAIQSNFRKLYSDAITSPILLPAGETNIDVDIQSIDDDDFGADEFIELSLLEGIGYRLSSDNNHLAIDVKDNDLPTGISIVPIKPVVNEGDIVKFQIISPNLQNNDLNISLNINETGGNYISEELPEDITLPAGESSVIVTIATSHDRVSETDGFIVANLLPSEDYTIAPEFQKANIVVTNIDVPAISIAGDGVVTEGGDAIFVISASFAPTQDLSINLQISGAVSNFLVEPLIDSVVLTAGNHQTELRLNTEDDETKEANGEILVLISSGEGYDVAETPANQATIMIIDNDSIQVSLSAESTKIIEGFQTDLVLSASIPPSRDLEVSLQAEFHGQFGYYFSPVISDAEQNITVTIPSGQRHAKFQLGTLDDQILEPYGTAIISLNSDTNYNVDSLANQVSIQVIDNDERDNRVSVIALTESIEEGESAKFSIRKSPTIATNLAIDLSIEDGAGNFLTTNQPNAVILSVAEHQKDIEVNTIDDEVAEIDGVVTVTILPNSSYEVSSNFSSASMTILDNDDYQPVVSISYNHPSRNYAVEGETIQFLVELNNPAPPVGLNIPVVFEYVGIEPGPFDSVTEDIEFGYGESTSQIVELELFDNGEFNSGQRISATIQPGENYTLDSNDHMVVVDLVESRIAAATVQIVPQQASIREGENAVFRIERSIGSELNEMEIEVNITEVGDYIRGATATTAMFEAERPIVYFEIPTLDDNIEETSGSVTVELVEGDEYIISQTYQTASILIHDNDIPVGISILPVTNTIYEGSEAQFQVFANPPSANVQQVNLSISQHGDFLAEDVSQHLLTIEPNSVSSYLSLQTLDDRVFETNGEISVSIGEGEGYSVSTENNLASIVVFDNDPQLGIAIVTIEESITEGQPAQFQISSSYSTSIPRSIDVAISQYGDFIANSIESTSVTIQPFSTIAKLVVETENDNVDEIDGQIMAELNPNNTDPINPNYQSATVSIQDDDEPILSINSVSNQQSLVEGSTLEFELVADRAPVQDLVIQMNVAETGDFLSDGTDNFEKILVAGQQTTAVFLSTTNDTFFEVNGEVELSIGAGEGYGIAPTPANFARIAILDNDQPPEVSISTTIISAEEGNEIQFEITLDQVFDTDLPVSVGIRKTIGNILEYEIFETVVIDAFETVSILTIQVEDNEIVEPAGEIVGEIQSGPMYIVNQDFNSSSISILDNDDQPIVAIQSIAESIVEGNNAEFKLQIDPISARPFEVGLLVADGDADFLSPTPIDSISIESYTREKIVSIETINDNSIEDAGESP